MSEPDLRIAHVVPGYLPARGGIETLVDGVAPALRDAHNIHTFLIAPRFLAERPQRFLNNGFEVISVNMPNRYSQESVAIRGARLFADCRVVLDQIRPDVLHIHGIWHLFMPMTLVGRTRGIPTIHHVHGELNSSMRKSHMEVLAKSSKVLAVSKSVAQSIRGITGRKLPIDVIRNGIPNATMKACDEPFPRIGLIGRLEAPKGFHHGILALSALVQEFPGIQASIVGVGEDLIPLQRLASRLGVAERLTFWGRASRSETLSAIADCSVVVIPSLVTEGFSIVAVEAALLGKPVVSYRVGGLPETIVNGITGTLVRVGDVDALVRSVSAYLSDDELRRAHGSAARERAQAIFNVHRFANDLAMHYRKLNELSSSMTMELVREEST